MESYASLYSYKCFNIQTVIQDFIEKKKETNNQGGLTGFSKPRASTRGVLELPNVSLH